MALRKRFSYQWRLFIPLVTLLWILVLSLLFFQVRRERAIRADILHSQLRLINERVITAYENDYDVVPFMHFVAQYFGSEFYDDIRMSVYDTHDGSLIYSIGIPLPNVDMSERGNQGISRNIASDPNLIQTSPQKDDMFFYSVRNSKDGNIKVLTAMPYNVTVADALKTDADMILIFIGIAVAMTFIAYVSTRYLGYTIRQLRDLAEHAATNREFTTWRRFPNDELGEIASHLVNIFNKSIHAQNKLEAEHRLALKATKDKAELKKVLTNNINHELKTPIGIIKGYIDTIVETPDMPDEQRIHFLKKAQTNVDRLCSMMNDLSTITRLEEAKDNIPVEEINFHELVFTVADEIKESGAAGNMKFVYDVPIDCEIMGNASLLTGALLNLSKNAAAYSQGTEMGVKLVKESNKFYTFAFYDNGTGVEEKHIPHLFDRFFRVDTGRSRKAGGTGLGLPIVKNTIVTLGGSITVANRKGGGLEFMFTLPKAKNSSYQTAESQPN